MFGLKSLDLGKSVLGNVYDIESDWKAGESSPEKISSIDFSALCGSSFPVAVIVKHRREGYC